jgi:hypothetical protein
MFRSFALQAARNALIVCDNSAARKSAAKLRGVSKRVSNDTR